ncbi:MAG TPA: hypothetical protein VM487_26045 [Phycisphaerae bacterium]|nr:hypothetical protein [Phycisphaerae bacterium]
MINEHADDLGAFVTQDPRGIHLPAFLATLATNLQNEHARIRDEMQSITESIGHVNTIVAMQQAYSSVGGLIVDGVSK